VSPLEIYRFLTELVRDGAGAVSAFLIGLVGGSIALWWYLRRRHRAVASKLRAENESLRTHRAQLRARCKELRAELARTRKQYDGARARVRDWWAQCRRQVRFLNERAGRALADVNRRLESASAVADRAAAVADDRGNPWLRPSRPDTPKFVPRAERGPAIIALLNVKGGVGKTTLAANLAATWAGRGERVLMIDLDYQGSLTQLVLPHTDLRVAAAERRLVQDYFATRAGADAFRPCVHRVPRGPGTLTVAPATDQLADVETWLQIRWLIRPGSGDVRFALRSALHDPAASAGFDRILLDCPPRLTTACVNALACCDYIIVPVILDRTSTLAGPRLFGLLRDLRPILMSDVVEVGLAANRTSRDTLIPGEADIWDELAAQCGDLWGRPVDRLPTVIPSRVAFRDAANEHRFAVDMDAGIQGLFAALAFDLQERVPSDRRRPSPVLG
jgi:cellulose biosynthesis protein BcsQ